MHGGVQFASRFQVKRAGLTTLQLQMDQLLGLITSKYSASVNQLKQPNFVVICLLDRFLPWWTGNCSVRNSSEQIGAWVRSLRTISVFQLPDFIPWGSGYESVYYGLWDSTPT